MKTPKLVNLLRDRLGLGFEDDETEDSRQAEDEEEDRSDDQD